MDATGLKRRESHNLSMAPYLSGDLLYGDDFPENKVVSWYRDEYDAYRLLTSSAPGSYRYVYHGLNTHHGYRYLGGSTFERVLGYGSFTGAEFLPIADRIRSLTILDPSGEAADAALSHLRVRHVRPSLDGRIPLAAGAFDLITCFGVLHHVPNVTFVISELVRVLAPGGCLLVREPIVSLGDWSRPRRGLTRHERGIPLSILLDRIARSRLQVRRLSYCMFAPLRKACHLLRIKPYSNRVTTRLDALLSGCFSQNVVYHPRRLVDRFCPSSVFLVLEKPTSF